MKKIIVGFLILSGHIYAASNNWLAASQLGARNNAKALSSLAQSNQNDVVIAYYNASANLNDHNPVPAVALVNKYQAGNYFSIDIMHQLLNFFFTAQNWQQFVRVYELLPNNQPSVNETCGYDTANFALGNNKEEDSDYQSLLANKMPLWCISLLASKIHGGGLPKSYLQPFLYNLVSSNQTAQFNQLASIFKYPKINFINYVPATRLSNQYQIVYRIANLAVRTPDVAFHELANSAADKFTKQYLYNQLGAALAAKHMFSLARRAIANGDNRYVSDDAYEWRTRTYMENNDWGHVLATINNMPRQLQQKSSWLYWRAFAYGKTGDSVKANGTLEQIGEDYSYYSLLAQAELRKSLDVGAVPSKGKLSQLKYADAAKLSFDLYTIGKRNNNASLIRLATQNLYYVINGSNDRDISTISQAALGMGWNEMSIYAGNKSRTKYASLSFPLLFSQEYRRYSKYNNISMSYPMAVTRQESRFNPNALAADGGVGLMQIMPGTASYIARKTHSSSCYRNYDCNIKFGTWYLGHLSQQFGNNLIYATAGYNAGPGRAHAWQINLGHLDSKIQIELIPFKITREYVQKVISNKAVYDSRLNNESQINFLQYVDALNHMHNTTYIIDDDESIVTDHRVVNNGNS